MLARATILRDYGSSLVAGPGEGAGGPAPPLLFLGQKFFLRPGSRVTSESGWAPLPPSERLDPPLQSNNRSQKFLLVSDRHIGFFRLGRQIRLLYNKALEICIKHEKEKLRSGLESWREFWHILSSFISQFLDLIQWMFSFFIRSQGFSLKKWPFPASPFFQGKAMRTALGTRFHLGNWCHRQTIRTVRGILMSHANVIHTFTVRKRLLSAWFKWSVEMLLDKEFCTRFDPKCW